MTILLAGILLAQTAAAAPPAPRVAAPDAAPRIVVGPNILVSRDGDIAHCETAIAANPKDSKNLLGASIVMARPDGGATNKGYVSEDGGATWRDVGFDEGEKGGGDPQTYFGASGTAYFMGISLANGIYVSRSEDKGKTWGPPIPVGKGDHEMLVADHTTGPYAGRVYVTLETSDPGPDKELEDLVMRRRVVLYRSADDGRSWTGPILVARGDGRGLAAYNLLVLSDGTLFLPMMEYPNYAKEKDAATWRCLFSLSRDGGVSFTPKRPVAEVFFGGVKAMRAQQRSDRVDGITGPVFGVDPGDRFKDRIYAAWSALEGSRFRLFVTYSSDRGTTWSKPRPLNAGAPPDASEYLPTLAVNTEGVVGLFYYDTKGFPNGDQSHVYFTASADGGETFLPPVRVSSEASRPFGSGNLRPGPFLSSDRGLLVIYTTSGLSRWKNGGDYIGMTADVDGAFHPLWADGRDGTYQLYTSRIRVATKPPAPKPAVEKAVVTEQLALVFDPARYDAQTREVRLPVRLKNTSKESLYPPFVVEVKEIAHPYTVKSGEPYDSPNFQNSSNGEKGIGATFEYAKALGGLEVLEPDGVTDAIVWKLQAESPIRTDFYIGAEVTGFVPAKETKK